MARTAPSGGSRGVLRGFVVAVAVLLAAGATAATVLTDDPQRLRLAVVGALWAFILLALAVPRRRADPAEAPDTSAAEAELRRAYEVELEREVAARREYELQLEVYLRRELEQGLAEDVQGLREELTRIRAEVLGRLDQPPPRDPRTDSVPFPPPAPHPSYPSYVPEPQPYESYESYESYAAAPPPRPGPLDDYLRAAVPADPPPREDALGPVGDLPSYAFRAVNGDYAARRANGDYGSLPAPRPAPLGDSASRPANGDYAARPANGDYGSLPAAGDYGPPPAPRPPADGEAVPHRRRARGDAEANEVLSRLLGR